MATALRVEAAVPGRRRAGTAEHALDVELAGPVPLGALIDAVVRSEVAAFRRRAEEQAFLRVLTDTSLAEGLAAGAVRAGDRHPPADVDEDTAVDAALLAFGDGLYEVIVDGVRLSDLDDVVALTADTHLLFLRLVALSGG